MTVRTIEYLLAKFGAGKSPGSSEYIDLIDTLADDRNAVYFSTTAPEDTDANPLWFNTTTNILSVYSNEAWSNIDLSLKAPLASPTLTGTPLAPTATAGTNTTQIATTAFVKTAVDGVIASAPGALDTLNEIATALGNDASFATTVTNSLAGKVSTSGGSTITASGAAVIPVIVKGAASQTANLQEWQTSAGVPFAWITPNGNTVSNFFNGNYLVSVYNTGSYLQMDGYSVYNIQRITTSPNFIVKGAASQTADLMQWQNSGGTVLAKVDSAGIGTFAQGVFAGGAATIDGGGGATLGAIYTGALKNSATAYNFFSNVTGSPYATVVVKGLSGQTTDLQQWQNSAGTVLTRVRPDGQIGVGSTLITGTNFFVNNTISTTNVVATIRGAASQTADLMQWQNSGGTVLAKVDSSGNLTAQNITGIGTISLPSTTSIGNVSSTEIGYLDGVTSAIQTQLNGKQPLEDTGWTTLSSFSNSYSGSGSPAYRKINNVVYLRGRVSGGTANTTAFNLPSGYRPAVDTVIAVQQFGTANINYVTVNPDGDVIPNGTAAWLSSVIFPIG